MRSIVATYRDTPSVLDVIVATYLAALLLLCVAGSGPDRTFCIGATAALFGGWGMAVAAVRMRPEERVTVVLHRAALLGAVLGSYLLLKWILPVANHASYDAELFALDKRIFRVEPTLFLQNYVTPSRTEWFAFFYFGYFPLMALYALPVLFSSRCQSVIDDLAMRMVPVLCIGHLTYMLVPGFGPYHHLGYSHALTGGRFYGLVLETVASAGAQKDIFPSLHTAIPVTLALFSYDRRDVPVLRAAAPVMAFIAINIMIATIYLRWHWAIDVVAGLTLAFGVRFMANRVVPWERRHRVHPAFPELPVTANRPFLTARPR